MESSATIETLPPIEEEVRRLRVLQREGRHPEVVSATEEWVQRLPENRDLMLILACSQRHLGRIDSALATLGQLEGQHPRFSRLHQERGLCHVAQKDAPNAIDALLRAVNLNPALPTSWSMLERLYRMIGDQRNSEIAASHVATLRQLPTEVVTATSQFSDDDLTQAEDTVRAFLIRNGDHPEAMRLLARIGMARDVLDDAEALLAGVLTLAPDYGAARYDYAQTLVQRHKYVAAREQISRLLALEPGNVDFRTLAATTAVGLGENETAIELYQGLLIDLPGDPDVLLWLAHALKTVGRVDEAVDAYRAAAAARPDFGDAYWSAANLKVYRFTDDELARMRSAEASSTISLIDRYHLCFALGKALEDRGLIDESWLYYQAGNALKRSESRYQPEIIEGNSRNQIAVCTRDFFVRRGDWGLPDADPIFIVGLPRSGSTLLEQILASHSKVEGTQELPEIQRYVLELQGRDPDLENPRYPANLNDLSRAEAMRLGQRYLADTRIYRTTMPFFIDKMPNNFRHIGLIQLMLPNARIIDARREPIACCFSNLKQLFARGQEFTYSVDDIARYYRSYLELMRHWDRALSGRVLRVQHEDVVEDLESSVRRLLDYCDLPFEPACIEFHKTRRSVRTPSSEQVRQPIFRDGLEQWKQFEPWLGPLKAALGDAVDHYRD